MLLVNETLKFQMYCSIKTQPFFDEKYEDFYTAKAPLSLLQNYEDLILCVLEDLENP